MKRMKDMGKTTSNNIPGFVPSSAHSPNQHTQIRLATPTDWDGMAHIYNEAIHSGRCTMDLIPVDANYFRKLTNGFTPREFPLVAEHATHIAAWGIVKQYSDRPGYALACETSVYVAEDFRGQDVGTALQATIVHKAWENDYRHLVAKIMAVNETSIRFHHHFDYQIAGNKEPRGKTTGNHKFKRRSAS